MFIYFCKFIHLLLTLGLLGLTFYSLIQIGLNRFTTTLIRVNKILLALVFFAMLTGTFLIYPKHFSFHTPWIQAAYLLVLLFSAGLLLLIFLKNQQTRAVRWLSFFIYSLLIMILFFIVHDAVTKTTLLYWTKERPEHAN